MSSYQALPQGAGYGMVVGIGFVFAAGIVLTMKIAKRYLNEHSQTSEMFMVANRSVGVGLTASAVFSSWMWATETLWGSVVGYNFGVSGPFWFSVGLAFHISLMCVVGIQVKLKAPNGHTMLEIVKFRYGVVGHVVFMGLCLINNIMSCSWMILSAAAGIASLTGMHIVASCMLIPFGVILYTVAGGLRATFLTDYVHTVIALVLLIYFSLAILLNKEIGGIHQLYDMVIEYGESTKILGNYQGSLLTFKSEEAIYFAIVHTIGNLGLVIMDTAFWQKSLAANLEATVPGYMIGSICIFCVSWALGTICGLSARVIEHLPGFPNYPNGFSAADIGNGLVLPYTVATLLGKGASAGIVIMLFMTVTSTTSAEMIAVSSIISFDLYRTYINPNASDRAIITVSHAGVIFFGLFAAGFAVMLHYVGTDLNWLGYFLGIVITPGVFPAILTLLWKRQSRAAATLAPILGLGTGMGLWLGTAKYYSGHISVETLGASLPNVWGNVGSMFGSLFYSVVITLLRPEDFDWAKFQKITLVNEDRPTDSENHSEGELVNTEKSDDSDTHTPDFPLDKNESSPETSVHEHLAAIDPATVDHATIPTATNENFFQPRLVIPPEVRGFKRFLWYIGWEVAPTDYSNHPLGQDALPVIFKWYKVAVIFSTTIFLLTWVIWPFPMYRDWVWGKSFFTGWVVVAILWNFLAFVCVCIFPLWSGRHSLYKVFNGLYQDAFHRKHKE